MYVGTRLIVLDVTFSWIIVVNYHILFFCFFVPTQKLFRYQRPLETTCWHQPLLILRLTDSTPLLWSSPHPPPTALCYYPTLSEERIGLDENVASGHTLSPISMMACGQASSLQNADIRSSIAPTTDGYGHVFTRCMNYMLSPTTQL